MGRSIPVCPIATSAISRPFRHRALRLSATREGRRASQVDWPEREAGASTNAFVSLPAVKSETRTNIAIIVFFVFSMKQVAALPH